MKKKILVAVALTFVGTSVLWVGGLMGLYFVFYGDAPPFRVNLEHPSEVVLGSEFDLLIDVTNARSERESLYSIDLYDSFLDGFELVGTEPLFDSHDHTFNFHTLWMEQDLMPDSPLVVRVRLRATEIGQYGGHVDVCTSGEVCTTVYATIDVVDGSTAS